MGSNSFIMLFKKRKALFFSIAIFLMVAAWGISYYIFLAQGNRTYLSTSKEIIAKVNKINSNIENLSSTSDFLGGKISNDFRTSIDNGSKDILKLQSQFSGLKYTPGYMAQAKNIGKLLNEELQAFNNISYITGRPLDFDNSKKMNVFKSNTLKVESLVYQIDMPKIMDKSNSLQGFYNNLKVFLSESAKNGMDMAYKTAQKELGDGVIQAIPFAFDDKNFIAARQLKEQGSLFYSVVILQTQGMDYVETWRNPGGFLTDGDLATTLFTVQDVDKDGRPDVTYFDQGSAEIGTGAKLSVYSPVKNTEYSIAVSQSDYYTKGSRQQIKISDNLKQTDNKVVYGWIKTSLTQNQIIMPELTQADMINDPNLAGDLWYKENVDLHGTGKTQINWYNGVAPSKGKTTAEVIDGNMDYKAFFQDGVYATDTQNNKFYVVYIPESKYGWIESMEISNGILTMHTTEGTDGQPGPTYSFDTTSQMLTKGQ